MAVAPARGAVFNPSVSDDFDSVILFRFRALLPKIPTTDLSFWRQAFTMSPQRREEDTIFEIFGGFTLVQWKSRFDNFRFAWKNPHNHP
jgi:hypothetical protein